jgi:hypothetical protein
MKRREISRATAKRLALGIVIDAIREQHSTGVLVDYVSNRGPGVYDLERACQEVSHELLELERRLVRQREPLYAEP